MRDDAKKLMILVGSLGALGLAPQAIRLPRDRNYSPCIKCGNPAKDGHCYKCQQKR